VQCVAILLDTGFYLGLTHPKDEYHTQSINLLKVLKTGKYGQVFTSNFIMAESATIVALRTNNNLQAIQTIREFFFGTGQIAIILRLNEDIEREIWALFQKINTPKAKKAVSFVDCSNIILCHYYSLEHILSYDPHFDGFLSRIC
jgi:predicted nucleic acid-binding protein